MGSCERSFSLCSGEPDSFEGLSQPPGELCIFLAFSLLGPSEKFELFILWRLGNRE